MKRKYIQMERIKDDSNSAYTLGNEALTIISNCVDYITLNSSLINQQIIRNFAAQILEVLLYQVVINQVQFSPRTLDKILKTSLLQNQFNQNINLRIIKPSKQFYNKLMGICLKFGVESLCQVHFSDFLECVKNHFAQQWNPQ